MRERYNPSEIEDRRAGWLHEKLTGKCWHALQWVPGGAGTRWECEKCKKSFFIRSEEGNSFDFNPDYFNSLDAVRVLEMAIRDRRDETYREYLRQLICSGLTDDMDPALVFGGWFTGGEALDFVEDALKTPPAQRMTALFRVKIDGVSAEEAVK